MYGVAFAIDRAGDVYLTGRVGLHAVTPDELDRLLGAVLEYADDSFDTMLSIGYGEAIRREWAWRGKRGGPLGKPRGLSPLFFSLGGGTEQKPLAAPAAPPGLFSVRAFSPGGG